MSNTSLLTKEMLLNELVLSKNEFFQELVIKALENEIITEEEYERYKNGMIRSIKEHIYEMELEGDLKKSSEIIISNHLFLVSYYLYETFKPAEAINLIKETSSFRIHSQAIRYYEQKVNEKYIELDNFETVVDDAREDAFLKESFNELKGYYKSLMLYDQHITELNTRGFAPRCITLDFYSQNEGNMVDLILSYTDSFMLEVKIRKKIGKKVVHGVKSLTNRHFELNNILVDTFVELICSKLCEMNEDFYVENKTMKKREVLRNMKPEAVFHIIFNSFEFSEEEKEYLRANFLKNV